MSALAQYLAMSGQTVTGSDREFDRSQCQLERKQLESQGIRICPQDGSEVKGATRIITSTAVEADIPDLVKAQELGLPILHRSELLAELLKSHESIAVAGVSGKSTVTGMIFSILRQAGHNPGLITGGDLIELHQEGLRGNAFAGPGPLIAEADESDGTLIRHHPSMGVVLNLHEDHGGKTEIFKQLEMFSKNSGRVIVSDQVELKPLRKGASVFGFGSDAGIQATDLHTEKGGSRFMIKGHRAHVPIPGLFNAQNALAAIAATTAWGVSTEDAIKGIANFQGIARRFQRLGSIRGIQVIDDFAHNPTKLCAALTTAQSEADRVLAVFRPHGFGPSMKFRDALRIDVPKVLRNHDRFDYLPIYDAGGTANRSISADDLATDLRGQGAQSRAVPDDDLPAHIAKIAKPGDLILIMGARDPHLPELARSVYSALSSERSTSA